MQSLIKLTIEFICILFIICLYINFIIELIQILLKTLKLNLQKIICILFYIYRAFIHNMHSFGLPKELCSEFLRKQCVIANLPQGIDKSDKYFRIKTNYIVIWNSEQIALLRENIELMYSRSRLQIKWYINGVVSVLAPSLSVYSYNNVIDNVLYI
jgi:hypothetical protein